MRKMVGLLGVTLLAACSPVAAQTTRTVEATQTVEATKSVKRLTLLDGQPSEVDVWVRGSENPGPTVMIVGGMHGNEPAGAAAAEQIVHWPLKRGRLVIIPRANARALKASKRYTPDLPDSHRNLNRNFVLADGRVTTKGEVAPQIWKMVERFDPAWLIDLHEGYDFHRINAKSVGSSVIAAKHEDAQAAADAMLRRINPEIADDRDFMLLGPPVATSLARSFHVQFNRPSMILETTYKDQRLPLRVRQHRHMVHTLLTRLGMIEKSNATSFFRDPIEKDRSHLVMLYDDGGVGKSIANVERSLRTNASIELIRVDGHDIRNGVLQHCDLLVFPGGSGSGQSKSLEADGRERVRTFVADGGAYLGVCAGGYLACDGFSWGLKIVDAKTVSNKWRRGVGDVEIQWTPAGAEIWEKSPQRLKVAYANGPIWTRNENPKLEDYAVLAHFRTELAKNGTPAGVMIDSPAAIGARYKAGRVLCFSPHLEKTPGCETYLGDAVTKWLLE